jgi:oxalate decarboxylase/phosphoglucose isomerase-like protein (cupin superfamily)
MAVSYMDYTSPNARFFFDLRNGLFFRKDAQNYFNQLTAYQMNTLGNTSLLDIHLSRGNLIEPHYHQNASELVVCISGSFVLSLLNPFTKELRHIPIGPGQTGNAPQGWWHYEIATADNTHLLAIFDAPVVEFIGGSDLLRLTPPDVLARAYCLDEAKVKETLTVPFADTVYIGPPAGCGQPPVPATVMSADGGAQPAAYPAAYGGYPQLHAQSGYGANQQQQTGFNPGWGQGRPACCG